MSPKWKYGPEARKARYCVECGKRLKKDEVVLCTSCFAELMTVTIEPETFEDAEDETD